MEPPSSPPANDRFAGLKGSPPKRKRGESRPYAYRATSDGSLWKFGYSRQQPPSSNRFHWRTKPEPPTPSKKSVPITKPPPTKAAVLLISLVVHILEAMSFEWNSRRSGEYGGYITTGDYSDGRPLPTVAGDSCFTRVMSLTDGDVARVTDSVQAIRGKKCRVNLGHRLRSPTVTKFQHRADIKLLVGLESGRDRHGKVTDLQLAGGKIEPGETVEEAALRELMEEHGVWLPTTTTLQAAKNLFFDQHGPTETGLVGLQLPSRVRLELVDWHTNHPMIVILLDFETGDMLEPAPMSPSQSPPSSPTPPDAPKRLTKRPRYTPGGGGCWRRDVLDGEIDDLTDVIKRLNFSDGEDADGPGVIIPDLVGKDL